MLLQGYLAPFISRGNKLTVDVVCNVACNISPLPSSVLQLSSENYRSPKQLSYKSMTPYMSYHPKTEASSKFAIFF